MKQYFTLLTILFFTFQSVAEEACSKEKSTDSLATHDHASHRASYAPAGIMGDHQHGKGSLMFTYRFMYMDMGGLRAGDSRTSFADHSGMPMAGKYPVLPRDMQMEMHMFGLMYGLTDKQTLTVMVPYVRNIMDHTTRMGADFDTESDGLGDITVGLLHELYKEKNWDVQLKLAFGAPTGSIKSIDNTPMGNGQTLPYPMQIGSGSWSFKPAITASYLEDEWSYGAQLAGTFFMGTNNSGYRRGEVLTANVWAGRDITKKLRGTLRLQATNEGDYHGDNPVLNEAMIPTADNQLRGRFRMDLFPGLDYAFTDKHRLAVEVGLPVYEKVDGVNLETDLTLNVTWQTRF